MMHRTRRLILSLVGLAGIGIVAVALVQTVRLASIGIAYKAKMLCSAVFVSKSDPSAAVADLEIDDLTILRYVKSSIDVDTRSVTATALGVIRREAVYRDGLGCALALDGLTPIDSPGNRAAVQPEDADSVQRFAPLSNAATPIALERVLDRAFSEPNALRPRRTRAVVVVHKGQVIAERYAAGVGPETPLMGWSMAKSVVNALAGILVKEGLLTLEDPALVPEWHGPEDRRGSITLDHLLRMSSGLRFDEDMSTPKADVIRMLLASGDMAKYAARKELTNTPGTKWQYSSGTTNIIAQVIRNALQDDAEYLSFPRRALFDRIGMAGAVLETDAAGTFVGSSFMYATARDWARLGMLYLQDGVWDGERVLPDGWVTYTTSPAPANPQRHYGAHFWLEVPAEYSGEGSPLPKDAFHAAGHEAQFVTIVPSHAAVVVRLGRTRYPEAWDHSAFVREVLSVLAGAN